MGAHSTSGGFHQKIPSHASKLSPQATTVPSKLPVFNANPQKTVICSHSCPRPLAEARAQMMCSRARTRASVRERPARRGRRMTPAERPAPRARQRHKSPRASTPSSSTRVTRCGCARRACRTSRSRHDRARCLHVRTLSPTAPCPRNEERSDGGPPGQASSG